MGLERLTATWLEVPVALVVVGRIRMVLGATEQQAKVSGVEMATPTTLGAVVAQGDLVYQRRDRVPKATAMGVQA